VKVVVTGAGGQLGSELARTIPAGCIATLLSSKQCDVRDAHSVAAMLEREQPDVLINAAGYTAVDKAETEIAAAERVNVLGPALLAAARTDLRVLHVSTDFVFDGAQGRPYSPRDPTHPLSVYGRTKLEGESPVLALGTRGLVLRTSWVYSMFGSNFAKTMLRLMATRPEVRVVADQVAAPTWARGLAETLWLAAQRPQLHGLHHWRDAGAASWYDFAAAIQEEALEIGLLSAPVRVSPITTQDYPTPAKRPSYSLLDCTETWQAFEKTPPHWRVHLRRMLAELKESNG
jgi:dTDP-4-dehydrorhamnose reductase